MHIIPNSVRNYQQGPPIIPTISSCTCFLPVGDTVNICTAKITSMVKEDYQARSKGTIVNLCKVLQHTGADSIQVQPNSGCCCDQAH